MEVFSFYLKSPIQYNFQVQKLNIQNINYEAEGTAGMRDITLNPLQVNSQISGSQIYDTYLNFTQIQRIINPIYQNLGTGRKFINTNGVLVSRSNCMETEYNQIQQYLEFNINFKYSTSFQKNCKSQQINLNIIDTQKEKQMELGSQWPYDDLLKGEIAMHKDLAFVLGAQIGDTFLLYFSYIGVDQKILENYFLSQKLPYDPTIYSNIDFKIPFTIKHLYSESNGKFTDGGSLDIIITESKYFLSHISQYIQQKNMVLTNDKLKEIQQFYQTQQIIEYSDEVILNIPDRFTIYQNPNYDVIQKFVTSMSSLISVQIGFNSVKMKLPVLEELFPQRFSQLFLGVIMDTIIFILFILSVTLMYSILLVSVETRTFEMGISRMIGLKKFQVIFLLLTQTLLYSLPSIILAILCSLPLLEYITKSLQNSLGAFIEPKPSSNAVLYSFIVGLLIPLFSSIYPIIIAMSQSLSLALDTNHSKSQAVKIIIEKKNEQVPWSLISFAIISYLFSISIYYFLPLSLLSFNLGLLLFIFFAIILGLIIGLVVLTMNFQNLFEKILVYVCFFWIYSAYQQIIIKNLASHREKNRRTAIMFSISIAFILFLVVSQSSLTQVSLYTLKQRYGTYLTLYDKNRILNVKEIEQTLDQYPDEIESYSHHTFLLDKYLSFLFSSTYKVEVTHVGNIFKFEPKLQGISPKTFDTMFQEFNIAYETSQSQLSLSEQLYTARGIQGCIIGELYAQQLQVSLKPGDSIFILINQGQPNFKKFELRIIAVLSAATGFFFSDRPRLFINNYDKLTNFYQLSQSIIVSIPTFRMMLGEENVSMDSIPIEKMQIKVKNGFDNTNLEIVSKALLQKQKVGFLSSTSKVWDYRTYVGNVNKAVNILNTIYGAVTFISMLLCFFSLVSSISANLLEQSKEISVFRSLGLTKNRMIFIYICESFVLIFSSCLMGFLIGTLVGFTMTLQRSLFAGLPVFFEFPINSFITISISSIILAIMSTFIPAKNIMNRQIKEIQRLVQQ